MGFHSFKKSIRSLTIWFKTIWRDRDWDHDFLYEILYKKLSNMYDYLSSNNTVALHYPNHLKRLRICKLLAKRIVNNKYWSRGFSGKDVFHGDYLKQQDLDMLHELMAKYSMWWWD